MNTEVIPTTLKDREQWIVWKAEERDGKQTKVPYQVSGELASTTDADTWTSFTQAMEVFEEEGYDGIGFVFSENDNLVGIDLDDIRDPETGDLSEKAEDVVDRLDSYTEISPSGTGLHIILNGFIPDGGHEDDDGEIEMYDHARYFTVTSNHLEDTPTTVEDRAVPLKEAHTEYIKDEETGSEPVVPNTDSEDHPSFDELQELIQDGSIDDQHLLDLYDGSATGQYPSRSEAEQALVCKLVWYGYDDAEIDRIMASAGIGKWQEAGDAYKENTIEKARTQYVTGRADWDSDNMDTPEYAELEEEEREWASVLVTFEDSDATNKEKRHAAAQRLQEEYQFKSLEDTEELFVYENGVYRPRGEAVIKEELETHLSGTRVSERDVRETTSIIKRGNQIQRENFHPPSGVINLQNGVLNINKEEIGPHTPEHYFRHKLPVEYDPGAEPTQFKEFLEEVMVADDERQKVQEFIGYCLMPWTTKYEKALMILGPTDSGKSVFCNTVTALFGEENVAHQAIQYLANERWGVAEIVGKPVNIRHDLDPGLIKRTSIVKELVSGNPLKAEQKGKQPFKARPTTKHVFSANRAPERESEDKAFFNRWITVKFPQTIPRKDQDQELTDKLTEDRELSGILNWALQGLERLRENGGFTQPKSPLATKDLWKRWGNNVEQFISEHLVQEDGAKIRASTAYNAYTAYAAQQGTEVVTQQQFTSEVKKDDEIKYGKPRFDGRKQRGFQGVRLSEEAQDEFLNQDDGGQKTL